MIHLGNEYNDGQSRDGRIMSTVGTGDESNSSTIWGAQ